MRNLLRDPVVLVTAAVVVVGVVIALVWASRSSAATGTEPDLGSQVGQALALEDVTDLREVVGETVVADRAEVLGVPADEEFWVGTGDEPAWVELPTWGESEVQVDVGDRVSFTGEVLAHDADFADQAGLSSSDAAELGAAGAHVEVDPDGLRVEG